MILENFLDKYTIKIHFQPIISTVNQKIIGYEALLRAHLGKHYITPIHLFEEARKKNLSFVFDKYVRALAIKKFSSYYKENRELLLFLNFESSLIDKDIPFNEFDFYSICKEEKIAPSNIVLELREDKICNSNLLEKFCIYYKEKGFNIALDDFGIGGSTFDRLSLVKPDIVKIDRSLVANIQNNFINAEILQAISKMCSKIGAIVLAEGVEEDKEILECIKNDISIYQGFYFGKPVEYVEASYDKIEQKIAEVVFLNKKMIREHKSSKQELVKKTVKYAKNVIENISSIQPISFSNRKISDFMHKELGFEALYLIDYHSAKQVGETLLSGDVKKFFSPAKHGDCHYLKEYYYLTKSSKNETFLSQKYISKATGNMCRTFAQKFTKEEDEYILCLDIKF